MGCGANISILGSNPLIFLEKHGVEYSKFNASVKTASGTSSSRIGKVEAKINQKDLEKSLTLYVAPSLYQ